MAPAKDDEYARYLTDHNSQTDRVLISAIIRKLGKHSLCRLIFGGHGQQGHNHGKKSKKMEATKVSPHRLAVSQPRTKNQKKQEKKQLKLRL